jgi:FAS-associated factor 2
MLNPQDTAARFKREFEEEYGPQSLPFFNNGYAQALDLAKKDLKFLLVLLMSPEHDDTSSFTRDTLLSPDFIALVNDPANNIILWAGNVRDSEAYQVSTALRCTKFPFTALITHTAESGPTSMSVVTRLTGPMPAGIYIAKLQSAITTYAAQLNETRQARLAQQFERTLRQEQDSAYERSLAQDRERARQRREQEAAKAAAEQKAQEMVAAAEKYTTDLGQWKRWRAQSISPEPTAETKDVVRIGFRMPKSAERITRRFKCNTNLEELYAFIECYDTLHEPSVSSFVSEPSGFKHEYKFRLVSPMPRTIYDLESGGSVLERIGKGGNLIVEPIVDDEGEDDGDDEQ